MVEMKFIYLLLTPSCSILLVITLVIAIVCCVKKGKSKAVILLSLALLIVITLYVIALIIDKDIAMLWVFFIMVFFEKFLNIIRGIFIC